MTQFSSAKEKKLKITKRPHGKTHSTASLPETVSMTLVTWRVKFVVIVTFQCQ